MNVYPCVGKMMWASASVLTILVVIGPSMCSPVSDPVAKPGPDSILPAVVPPPSAVPAPSIPDDGVSVDGEHYLRAKKNNKRYAPAIPRTRKSEKRGRSRSGSRRGSTRDRSYAGGVEKNSYAAPASSEAVSGGQLPPSYDREPGDKSKITAVYQEGDTTTLDHEHPPE